MVLRVNPENPVNPVKGRRGFGRAVEISCRSVTVCHLAPRPLAGTTPPPGSGHGTAPWQPRRRALARPPEARAVDALRQGS